MAGKIKLADDDGALKRQERQLFDEIIYGNDNLFSELPVLFCVTTKMGNIFT